MKKSLFLSAIAFFGMMAATSCGNKAENNVCEDTVVVSIDSVVANPEAYMNDTITVEGVVSHLCAHGGRKAFLLGSDENVMIRCEATPEMGGAFPQESVHKPMQVTGVVVESRLGEEEVKQIEAQHAEQVKMIAEQAGAEQAAAVDQAATGCETERKAQGQGDIDSFAAQMADYRARIAERSEKEGKPYLSTYYIIAYSYDILSE
ncbi:MAG: hypothetical protein HDS68_08375 [Bacteroidales bacterium]|nr:hypothetical protein [Bacteroidales bacterium]